MKPLQIYRDLTMGIKLLLSCDGPGCTLTQEREPQYTETGGIDKITFARNGQTFWEGYLCARCEQDMQTALIDALPKCVR
jgi:hypothetical protein